VIIDYGWIAFGSFLQAKVVAVYSQSGNVAVLDTAVFYPRRQT
jgi:hypothetical protein